MTSNDEQLLNEAIKANQQFVNTKSDSEPNSKLDTLVDLVSTLLGKFEKFEEDFKQVTSQLETAKAEIADLRIALARVNINQGSRGIYPTLPTAPPNQQPYIPISKDPESMDQSEPVIDYSVF